jgi:ElaB/YqjD/DUF883 family membrane-anchored ribosome-binding protein
LGQICLAGPLAKAAIDAQRPFLKEESFNLISQLIAVKPDPKASTLENLAAKEIREQTCSLLAAIEHALGDSEMAKPKRIRPVLKAVEKLIASTDCHVAPAAQQQLGKILRRLEDLYKADGGQVKSQYSKLIGEIKRTLHECEQVEHEQTKPPQQHTIKKIQKSSKKKKKRKN